MKLRPLVSVSILTIILTICALVTWRVNNQSSEKNLDPLAVDQNVRQYESDLKTITSVGRHSLFSGVDGQTVALDIRREDDRLSYTASIVYDKRSLTRGPWELQEAQGWLAFVDVPNVWVFDGTDEVRVITYELVREGSGLSVQSSKDFPDILIEAPDEFISKLPDKITDSTPGAQQGNPADALGAADF